MPSFTIKFEQQVIADTFEEAIQLVCERVAEQLTDGVTPPPGITVHLDTVGNKIDFSTPAPK